MTVKKRDTALYIVALIMVVSMVSSILSCVWQIDRISDRTSEEESIAIASTVDNIIEGGFLSPIVVSETMCRDYNLRRRLSETAANPKELYEEEIASYLKSIRDGFGYQMVFVVSDSTKAYYTYDGISKFVDTEGDIHDVWYKDFVSMNKHYDLDVDTDEANHWDLAVFVNTEIRDDDGTYLGVCGVAVEMNELQQTLIEYEKKHNLKINLIDKEALVQVDTDTEQIENIYLSTDYVTGPEDGTLSYFYEGNSSVVTKYIPSLDWYLVVRDLQPDKIAVGKVVLPSILIFFVGCLLMVTVFILVTAKEKHLMKMSMTDALTRLENRRAFDMACKSYFKQTEKTPLKMISVDVNGLKTVNDKMGHTSGDDMLKATAEGLKKVFAPYGRVYRIGGDEYMALVSGSDEEVARAFSDFEIFAKEWTEESGIRLSISKAVIEMSEYPEADIEELKEIVDKKMYEDKMHYYEMSGEKRR